MQEVVVRHLAESDNVTNFDCGEVTLNDYIKNKAMRALSANGAVTWVIEPESPSHGIRGYYSAVFGSVSQEEAPKAAKGAVHPYRVPTYLIARLAVDVNSQGQGLGAVLLLHALREAVLASDIAGLRMVTVDALDPGKVVFYQKFGFKKYSDLGLFMLIKDIRKTLG